MVIRGLLVVVWSLTAAAVCAQDADDESLPPPPPPNYQQIVPPAPPAAPAKTDETSGEAPATVADEPDDEGARTHDGLQLRLAVGFGGASDAITIEGNLLGAATIEYDASAGGGSLAFHLGIGGEIAEGLTLGGFLLSESVTDPEIEFEGVTLPNTVDLGTFGMVGVYMDYYPAATGGFHFGGGVGGATIKTTDDANTTSDADEQPGGGGIMLLIGYDWWVGDQWSLGILGRFTGAGVRGENVQHDLGALSAMFSATYH